MIGKVNDGFFTKAILPNTGAAAAEVIVGPRMGVDAGIVRVGDQYMAIAEDPIFPGPTTSPEDFGWITVHIGASDVAVMGIKPQFMTYTLLLPPGTGEDYISRLVKSISENACELGISIVGGHTGFYDAVNIPIIGGITVWGMGKDYVSPAGAKAGDLLIITKGAAIEAAGILAQELGDELLAAGLSKELLERAKGRFWEMTVVRDAEIAMAAGGVHAMHDATEGGLARGLWEVAEASRVGLRVERKLVPVPQDIQAVCEHFKLDPFEVISEGTLIIACEPTIADTIIGDFRKEGIDAAVIGEVVPLAEGRSWINQHGSKEDLLPPAVDLFWEAFGRALAEKTSG
ncbi:MAG: AIR synthase family protein [Thermacetogeniaceae bacterium]